MILGWAYLPLSKTDKIPFSLSLAPDPIKAYSHPYPIGRSRLSCAATHVMLESVQHPKELINQMQLEDLQ